MQRVLGTTLRSGATESDTVREKGFVGPNRVEGDYRRKRQGIEDIKEESFGKGLPILRSTSQMEGVDLRLSFVEKDEGRDVGW